MTRVQCSLPGKVLSWILLLVLSFSSVQLGLTSLSFLAIRADSWQDSTIFSTLLRSQRNSLVEYVANWATMQDIPSDQIGYLDMQQWTDLINSAQAKFDPTATSFRFQVRSQNGNQILLSNLDPDASLANEVETVYYSLLSPTPIPELEDQGCYVSFSGDEFFLYDISGVAFSLHNLNSPFFLLAYGVPSSPALGPSDEISVFYDQYVAAGKQYYPRAVLALICVALAFLCLVYILWSAGHRNSTNEVVLSWLDRVVIEIYFTFILIILCSLFCGIAYFDSQFFPIYEDASIYMLSSIRDYARLMILSISFLSALAVGSISLLLRTIAVRCKGHAVVKTSILCSSLWWLSKTVSAFFRSLPLTWKTAAAFLAYFYLNLAFFTQGRYNGLFTLFWVLLNGSALFLLCRWTFHFRRLKMGSEAIASGNLKHQIDTSHMPRDLRDYAEDLNNISIGMSSAVDEQMKSERFKAELITNVSHDLKTPLTSIINYVNLLKSTHQDDPKAIEYIEVLDRKSLRLKKLTEDLVEASKASTGALNVNREKISMSQLVDQALGEWMEKLEEHKLTVVTNLPEGETFVYADGRHLWRVIDNLLSNCAKYAMESTRIYLDLSRGNGQVIFSVKNISREALNIPPERLMERFVRGEESRSTEGSGLGLSIARSLTELQGGTFSLSVDGDLFKATIALPQAN